MRAALAVQLAGAGLDQRLVANPAISAYIGFDCTARSLHVGSLVQIMMLHWLQQTGGKPGQVAGPDNSLHSQPSNAIKNALDKAGWSAADLDFIEINEAFAAQVLSCLKGLGVAFDDKRVNPNGGAIALGHPLGASGARLATTAVNQLHRTGGRYALCTMCIGVGQGIAVVLERV